jgi:hypothetical protein
VTASMISVSGPSRGCQRHNSHPLNSSGSHVRKPRVHSVSNFDQFAESTLLKMAGSR